MSSFLKRSSERVGKLIVKELLHAKVGGPEPARGQTNIHASDLTKQSNQWGVAYCPREVYLRQRAGLKRPPEFLPVATQVTFNEGNDKQWRLNNDWLVDIMVGDWYCANCGAVEKWCKKPEYPCSCDAYLWRYQEVRIIDRISGASAGIDANAPGPVAAPPGPPGPVMAPALRLACGGAIPGGATPDWAGDGANNPP